MLLKSAEQFDGQEIYCRKLGHHLCFSYCRKESSPDPCKSIKNCWQHHMAIAKFIEGQYDEQDLARLREPAVPKMTTILNILQKVQQGQKT